ncbi:type II secretion system F family protein [bacterium]|nr:type II secretion system F family protein [bacterium]
MAYTSAPRITAGVSAQVQAMAFRQLAALLKAGMTLDQALASAAQSGPFYFRNALNDMARGVGAGQPLSEILDGYRGMFHPVVLAIVRAGELTGNLDTSFAILAEFFEAEAELRRTIQGALVYPIIVVVTAILAVAVLAWVGFMPGTWAVRLFWGLVIIAGLWLLMRFRIVQKLARFVAMLLPFFGSIMQQLAISRFCYTFGLMTQAGVPYLEGLETARTTVMHPLVERAVDFVYAGVRNGVSIEDSIRAQPVFPAVVTNLIGSGEQAGSLDSALLKAAEFLRTDAEYKIKAASKFAGPVAIVIVGIIVALILISFWSSYFQNIMSVLEE